LLCSSLSLILFILLQDYGAPFVNKLYRTDLAQKLLSLRQGRP